MSSDTAPDPFADPAGTWNQRYQTEGFLFGTEPNDYLQRVAPRLPAGGRVLCVADGEGRNSVWLARQGFQVEAFDIAALGVDKARRLAAQAGVAVHYEVAGCDDWRWPEAEYDAVVAVFVQFADPPARARLFEHMAAALRPGGCLVLLGYTPRQLAFRSGGPGRVEHLYTPELLRTAFAGLEILELVEYEHELAEGTQHVGRAALIGLLARRR
ncbi:SAM-dependent methyltransferase [Rubrivivax gelatinosus]|uniref:class I SAM-dependent methyltransferase n=1 Tax=Rubrivivax gelatinosus TaxID=28068 RepID=UPI001903A2B6|nr:class I SAM-dependent methyltransferase [Rubrivivax gelatinosus]MBK1613826.1 SAM-dependent methyltransferase [Rubrivivax gelatinosus]